MLESVQSHVVGWEVESLQEVPCEADFAGVYCPVGGVEIAFSSLAGKEIQEFRCCPCWAPSDLKCISTIQHLDGLGIDLVVCSKDAEIFRYARSVFAWIYRLI